MKCNKTKRNEVTCIEQGCDGVGYNDLNREGIIHHIKEKRNELQRKEKKEKKRKEKKRKAKKRKETRTKSKGMELNRIE
eukprot:scaffold50636_cov17-Prasinocladus_malaysianus.AAC.2